MTKTEYTALAIIALDFMEFDDIVEEYSDIIHAIDIPIDLCDPEDQAFIISHIKGQLRKFKEV